MFKIGIIGTGAIANTHIESYKKFPDKCKIVAAADCDEGKAQSKIDRFELDAVAYDDHNDMLGHHDLDLVSVCTPPFAHAQPTIDALNAGVNVLLEKPMATSLAECDAMIAAAEQNDKFISIVAQNRFKNPMMKLKQVLESGLAGKIVHAQVESFWWRGGNYYDLWWRGTWEKEGGGCTMNHAVHHIDLYQWMMGMPTEIQAFMTNISHTNSEVEDFSTAVMIYPDGKVGQLTASLVHHGENQKLLFQGEAASVSAPWRVQASLAMDNGFPKGNPDLEAEIEDYYQGLPDLDYQGHDGQIANVLAALEGEEDLLIDGVAGRKTLELVFAIYQSSTTGERVNLPMKPDDPFYTRDGIMANAPRFYEKTKSVESASEEITYGSDYEEEA